MKLLLDQNISFRAVRGLQQYFPWVRQVSELNLVNATDRMIWEYAKREGCTIVTFDSDFYDLTLVKGIPPKVIWLRLGNTSTEHLIKVMGDYHLRITEFIQNPGFSQIGCLELYET
jgi:predicted nuclease of predicted toxin-antitoxin system